jgi:hypothetical protein
VKAFSETTPEESLVTQCLPEFPILKPAGMLSQQDLCWVLLLTLRTGWPGQ